MPFTPFHGGPGLLMKAAAPKHFSFIVFFASQIFIDFEVLWNLYLRNERLHTNLHSYLGSLVVAAFCLGFFKWIWLPVLKILRSKQEFLTTRVIVVSSLIGVWSHVLLDSIMHADLEPFWPWSSSNPLWHLISVPSLHLFCIASGILGLAVLALRAGRRNIIHK